MALVEVRQLAQLVVASLALAAFSFLYSLGGREQKALRRYVGSSLFALACIGIAFWSSVGSWWQFLSWPALMAALTLGYGANTLSRKLIRRFLYGLVVGLASVPFFLPMGLWELALFQTALAVVASTYYGIRNPMSAVGEEGQIGLLMVACWPFAAIR